MVWEDAIRTSINFLFKQGELESKIEMSTLIQSKMKLGLSCSLSRSAKGQLGGKHF